MSLPYELTAKGKIEYWIKQRKPGEIFWESTIFKHVVKRSILHSTIRVHLKSFATRGLIRKHPVRNPDQVWIVK